MQLGDNMQNSSLAEIYARYSKVMLYVANRILGNQSLAEDAVQNAFVKILKHPEHVLSIPIDELKPYLIVVSENSARTVYRNLKKMDETPLENVDLIGESSPEDTILPKLDMIFNMPQFNSQYRDIIILKYYYDMDDRTIAQTLDISEINVRVRLSRAKNQMRKILDCGGVKE
jgi:RNA polymerase sigma-70 factor, ECF subfamily